MKGKCFLFLAILAFLAGGCAGPGAMGKFMSGLVPTYTSIPSPRAGLVLPIHSSPAVWAEVYLFEGYMDRYSLFSHDPSTGGLPQLNRPPIKHFTIPPPAAEPSYGVFSWETTVPLVLEPYPREYTMVVVYRNFRGWVRETEIIRFYTTGHALNDYYVQGQGRRIYADQVIWLSRVRPFDGQSRLNFHVKIPVSELIYAALGW